MTTRSMMDEIKSALEDLQHDGRIDPEAVVSAARDPHHPLHKHFDWDDQSAGHKFRITQAAALIRRVKLRVRTTTVSSIIPVYVQDVAAQSGFYSLTAADINRSEAEASVDAELARIRGNIARSRGVVAALDVRFPGLLAFFEGQLTLLCAPPQPRASTSAGMHRGASASPAPPLS
jgi:hypothetical protein